MCAMLEVIYEQRERVFHRGIQTRENNVWKHECVARVFLLIVFECLDISVGHELEFFIRLLKLVERCCEKSVYTGRGINLEKCVFSGCSITFAVDDKKWITK